MKTLRLLCYYSVENVGILICSGYVTLSATTLAAIAAGVSTSIWYSLFHERSWAVAGIAAIATLTAFFFKFCKRTSS